MKKCIDIGNYPRNVREAVQSFWSGRRAATEKQKKSGKVDQGNRSAVTGGKNLDAFTNLFCELVKRNGLKNAAIHVNKKVVTLPGYFRPTKQWDLLIMDGGKLIAVIELKSICGPSYGNNVNNRSEEAIGSGIDFQKAVREGAFGEGRPPFLGFIILVEEDDRSRKPVSAASPHFPVDVVFDGASYIDRLHYLCERMVRESLYSAASVVVAPNTNSGDFKNAGDSTSIKSFLAAFAAKIAEASI